MTAREQTAAAEAPEPQPAGEAALWGRLRENGSAAAREQLFAAHLPFARKIARQQQLDRSNGDIDLQDLYQLACAGLLEAIDRFDPAFGVPFRGYAARRIRGSVLDGIARMSEVREQISFRQRMRRERLRSLTEDGAANLPVAGALQALANLAVGLALGFMLEGTGLFRGNEEDPCPTAYQSLAWKDMLRRVTDELETLPEREQTILRRHYLDGLEFERIADLLGLSKGRISQLHKAALHSLRKRLARAGQFNSQT